MRHQLRFPLVEQLFILTRFAHSLPFVAAYVALGLYARLLNIEQSRQSTHQIIISPSAI